MVIDKTKQKAKLVLKMNDYLELISTHCALLFHTKCVYFSQKACFRQNKIPNRFAVKEYILIVLILAPFMSSQLRFSNEVILKITETKMKRLSLLC